MMKNLINKAQYYLLLVLLCVGSTSYAQNNPIVVDTTSVIDSCTMLMQSISIAAPTQALTGAEINLNITIPGFPDSNCIKKVRIETSPSLILHSSPNNFPFTQVANFNYENSDVIKTTSSQNFNVTFKFPGLITCDRTPGTFKVTLDLECNGIITSCELNTQVIARAENYWTIKKEFIAGDLSCGFSTWKIYADLNNSNPAGQGTYSLNGTVTDNGYSFPVSFLGKSNNVHSDIYRIGIVTMENCDLVGNTKTNQANFNLMLGDGCEPWTGTIQAISPPLVGPNPKITFSKIYDINKNLAPGCENKYFIKICNTHATGNGNVPWTNFVIKEDFRPLYMAGIQVTDIQTPAGWEINPPVPPGSGPNFFNRVFEFKPTSPIVLNPGECTDQFVISFKVNSSTPVGKLISNTAYLDYQAVSLASCSTINCPVIDTTTQKTSVTSDFRVVDPAAKPTLKKCIKPSIPPVPHVYKEGDVINFCIMLGTSGAGDLTTTITDNLGATSGQNLELDLNSFTYKYYENESTNLWNSCHPTGLTEDPWPGGMLTDTTNNSLQNISLDIKKMPGQCNWGRSNFLIVEYKATVLAQPFGPKTNTATVPGFLDAIENYTIEEIGVLGIQKEVDTTIAASGQTVNFTLTATNNGSVPLKNIEITDLLPDCFQLIGNPIIEDSAGNSVDFLTPTSNLVLTVHPANKELQPGESFIATFSAIKSGEGTCCNPSASVTANMTTTGIQLNAQDGSEDNPAACVDDPVSGGCCQIPDVMITLEPKGITGKFSLGIDSGAASINKLEVSMDNYRVDYDNDLCVPTTNGVIGNIWSSTLNFSGLTLTNNNTQLASWVQGTPAVLNGNVEISVSKPGILNLPCCNGTFRFCLKVKITDVNGNVCEKLICGSTELKSLQESTGELKLKEN